MCSGPRGEGLGLLRYMGYQRYGRPQRVWLFFGLFMCEKGVNFIHIGLIKGVFFTLAWHWVLNTHIYSIYVSLFITIYTTFGVLESIYHMTIGSPL